jgi:Zn-dependent metalloprotease
VNTLTRENLKLKEQLADELEMAAAELVQKEAALQLVSLLTNKVSNKRDDCDMLTTRNRILKKQIVAEKKKVALLERAQKETTLKQAAALTEQVSKQEVDGAFDALARENRQLKERHAAEHEMTAAERAEKKAALQQVSTQQPKIIRLEAKIQVATMQIAGQVEELKQDLAILDSCEQGETTFDDCFDTLGGNTPDL